MKCLESERKDRYGYGKSDGMGEHRTVYIEQHGDIPKGHQVHHLCGNKGCILVDHLITVSVLDHAKMHRTEWGMGPTCTNGHMDEWGLDSRGARICHACTRISDANYRAEKSDR